MPSFSSIALAAMMASMVSAHGAIIAATGDAGGSGMALGVDTSTPRDGTNRDPFQQDSTRFRGDQEETLGETLGGGDNNLEVGTTAIMAETGDDLPQITPGGEVQMTLHQVNSDGAGPYTCMINADGTATSWTNIPVTTNLEGNRRGRNRDGEAQDFPLVASVPANQECTGTVAGQDNVCLVRCENPARAGPFGGVVPVQMVTAAAEDEEEEEAAAADDEEEAADEEEETAAADEEEEAADEEEETAAADEEEDEDEAEAEDDEEEEEEDAAKRIRRSHIARFSRI